MFRRFLLPLTFLLLCAGCQRTIDPLFRWTPIDSQGDSLVLQVERMLVNSENPHVISLTVDKLDSLAIQHPELPQLRVRANFFKARLHERLSNEQLKYHYYRKAIEFCDSAKYPYDMARLAVITDIDFGHNFMASYKRLHDALSLARKTNDRLLEAEALSRIAHIKVQFDEPRKQDYYTTLDSLYRILGLEGYASRNHVNIALMALERGDSLGADSILQNLLKHPDLSGDTFFVTKVLFDLALTRRSSNLMQKSANLALQSGLQPSSGIVQEARWNAAFFMVYDSTTPQADSLVALLSLLPDTLMQPKIKSNIMLYNARRLERLGDHKGALELRKQHLEERLHVDSIYDASNVMRMEARQLINNYDKELRHQRTVSRLQFCLLLTITLAVALISYFIISRRLQRLRQQKTDTETQLSQTRKEVEQTRREIVTHNLAMTEKDNLLQTLVRNVRALEASGRITRAEARTLDAELRVHLSGRLDWEAFCHAFEKVHPSFVSNLRQRHPNLTEGDIKLAVYIRSGMGTKQIARMLQLQPTSIKMNRHRLRERLGLPPSTSLEDYLSLF